MIRLLRGRVALRPLDPPAGLIALPDQHREWRRKDHEMQGVRARSSHSGRVLAAGPPALNKWKEEVPQEFKPGDEVIFVYHHSDKWSEDQVWEDGGPVEFVSQEEILAVIDDS